MIPLVWRATFIDIEEEPGSQLQRAQRRPRSQSLPCVRAIAEDIFADEKAYVAELCGKFAENAASAWREGKEGTLFRSAHATQPKLHTDADSTNGALSSLLLHAKAKGMCAKSGTADGETREPSGLSSLPPTSADGDSSLQACNIGSIGHPVLCSRPCLFFAADECANGAACEFCHMAHAKRPSHLNKQHRELLRDMESSRARALILPIVRAKVQAFDATESSALAVDRLATACGVADAPRLRLSREERSLKVALSGMNLRLVLMALLRGAVAGVSGAESAAEALLGHQRTVV